MGNCKVTVLMSVYNGEKYLREAVESILNQTYTDFEFLIINDASTDKSMEILDRYVDSRIRIVSNEKNLGLTKSLNKGLSLAKGQYIARMDADDISYPERLQKQVQYLEEHSDTGLVGTWYERIDENNRIISSCVLPTKPKLMSWYFLFGSAIAHPTVMMRLSVVKIASGYDESLVYAQDYEFWTRLNKITPTTNIPEILLKYRVWGNSAGNTHIDIQDNNTIKIMQSQISSLLGFEIPIEKILSIRMIIKGLPLNEINQIKTASETLCRIYAIYSIKNKLCKEDKEEIKMDISNKLCFLALSASKISIFKSVTIFIEAAKINHDLIRGNMIQKGLKKLLRKNNEDISRSV